MEVHMISMPRSNPKNESNSRACLYSGEIGTGESPALLDSTAKPYAKALLWLWRFPSKVLLQVAAMTLFCSPPLD